MRLVIVAVGRAKRGPETELFAIYQKRLSWPLSVIEVEEKRKLSDAERIEREATLISQKIPDDAVLVALDERGEDLQSRDFASLLGGWENQGVREVAFVIGGANGLSETLRQRARKMVRFGRATWPHMLVRPMLAEQLYRAKLILDGHPYHRD